MLRHWFRHGGVPVNLYAKRLCGASRRALAPPSSSIPQPRRIRSVEVRGEESPDRGNSSRPRAPQEAPGRTNPPKAGSMRGGPLPSPTILAPPTARPSSEQTRGPGHFYSEPPGATQRCAGHPRQTPGALIVQPHSGPKSQARGRTGASLFLPHPAHSPRPRPLT